MADNFASAELVETTGGAYTSDPVPNGALTVEAGEPLSIYAETAVRTAWWSYTPDTSGSVTIDTEGTDGDTILDVFTGYVLNDLTLVAFDDNSGTGLTSQLTMNVVAGVLYYIRVSAADAGDDPFDYVLAVNGPDSMDPDDVPPIDVIAQGTPNNNLFANPYRVDILTNGGTYTSDPIYAYDYDLELLEDGSGFRSAWWAFTPLYSGMTTVHTHDTELLPESTSPDPDTELFVYTGNTFASLNEVASNDDDGLNTTSQVTFLAETGVTYHIRVVAKLDEPLMYVLNVTGPRSVGTAPTEIISNPLGVDVEIPEDGFIWIDLQLVDPGSNDTLTTYRPAFRIQVIAEEAGSTFTIEVEYDDNSSFASPTSLTKEVTLLSATALVTLSPTSDLAADTYYWRVRWTTDDFESGWFYHSGFPAAGWFELIAPISFQEPVEWEVNTTLGRDAHLWDVRPPRGRVGDDITIYGFGFPTGSGSVTLADELMTVVDWDHIAATSQAATQDRVINPGTLIDPEHDEVVATVPDVPAPGGNIVIE